MLKGSAWSKVPAVDQRSTLPETACMAVFCSRRIVV
jgi:hypothetical protein